MHFALRCNFAKPFGVLSSHSPQMNLVIDIGNTMTKAALFEQRRLVSSLFFPKKELSQLAAFVSHYHIDGCIVSAVSEEGEALTNLLGSLGTDIVRLSGTTPIPFCNLYKTPATLGSDRIAAVAGAQALYPEQNVLIVDLGTCITFDMLNSKGQYVGGNISLGFGMRFKALHEHTARLPLVDSVGVRPPLGYDTETAIRSGVVRGIQHEIEGYIAEIAKHYETLRVVLTGGRASTIDVAGMESKAQIEICEHLVEHGLNEILIYNQRNLTLQI